MCKYQFPCTWFISKLGPPFHPRRQDWEWYHCRHPCRGHGAPRSSGSPGVSVSSAERRWLNISIYLVNCILYIYTRIYRNIQIHVNIYICTHVHVKPFMHYYGETYGEPPKPSNNKTQWLCNQVFTFIKVCNIYLHV